MDLNRLLSPLLGVVGLALIASGLLRWSEEGVLMLDSRILLGAGLAIALNVVFAPNRRIRSANRRAGFPPEDELSRKWKHHAGYVALHLSFLLWMAIFLLQDLFGQAGINSVGNGPATVAVDQADCTILLIALLQASGLSVADLQQNGGLFQIDALIKHMLQYPDSL